VLTHAWALPVRRQAWATFGVLVSIVLGALFVLWINPSTGFGDEYITAVESISPNSQVVLGGGGRMWYHSTSATFG
jgi:ferric-dicitrate binding protein FerR (iron transport regulator)